MSKEPFASYGLKDFAQDTSSGIATLVIQFQAVVNVLAQKKIINDEEYQRALEEISKPDKLKRTLQGFFK